MDLSNCPTLRAQREAAAKQLTVNVVQVSRVEPGTMETVAVRQLKHETPGVEKIIVGVRHGVVHEAGVEKIRLAAPPATKERKPHAWSVAGTVREEQPPEGWMGRIVGVKVRCEHCGAEAVVDMPGGICQA